MANFVIKKDGTKVPFDAEKIRSAILAAASQAGLKDDAAADTAQQVLDSISMALSGEEEIPTVEIKDKIIFELDTIAPDVSAAWKKYEESKE